MDIKKNFLDYFYNVIWKEFIGCLIFLFGFFHYLKFSIINGPDIFGLDPIGTLERTIKIKNEVDFFINFFIYCFTPLLVGSLLLIDTEKRIYKIKRKLGWVLFNIGLFLFLFSLSIKTLNPPKNYDIIEYHSFLHFFTFSFVSLIIGSILTTNSGKNIIQKIRDNGYTEEDWINKT